MNSSLYSTICMAPHLSCGLFAGCAMLREKSCTSMLSGTATFKDDTSVLGSDALYVLMGTAVLTYVYSWRMIIHAYTNSTLNLSRICTDEYHSQGSFHCRLNARAPV